MEIKNLKPKLIGLAVLVIGLALLAKFSPTAAEGVSLEQDGENFNLVLDPKGEKVFVVSGWKIKTSEDQYILPEAANLPMQGKINEVAPVVISVPTRIRISWKHSPIGVSFRENKCTGLLAYFQKFDPPLSPPCPDCRGESEFPEYNLCVEAHRGNPDFFYNSWRLYLFSDEALWNSDMRIRLDTGDLE